jgi:uncharacterized protein (DUF1501 family)
MRCTRREALRLGVAGLASLGLGGCRGRAPDLERRGASPQRRGVTRPRYIVTILLTGGMDAIWTTDPRERAEIEPDVDLKYPASAIVEAGALRLGPHLAALAPVAARLSVVNGVQVATVSHNWGWLQFDRLRTGIDERMPVIGSLLGETRDGQPFSVVHLPHDEVTFRRVERVSPADRHAMAAALGRQRRQLSAAQADGPTGHSLGAAAALVERMATASPFVVEPWLAAGKPPSTNLQQILQRALWAIEHDLVACCQLSVDRYLQPWDSHWDNDQIQTAISGESFTLIARFLGQLGERRNAHGLLADQTLVVIGSELGRYPRLNTVLGKDHWPEVPFLFWGAGVVHQQTFGRTGTHLQAVPVSLRTGRDVATGGELLTLDDIGTTLLHLAGVDPEPRGYVGRRLDFLVAA